MKPVEPWKAIVFVGTLTTVAITINYVFGNLIRPPPPETRTYAPAQPTVTFTSAPTRPNPLVVPVERHIQTRSEIEAEHARIEHERFLAKYREPGISRDSGKQLIAVAACSDDRNQSHAIATALAQKFRSSDVRIDTSVFTADFFADGLFVRAFEDPLAMCGKLDLYDVLSGVVLGRETIEYSQDPSLENVISAHVRLEVLAFSFASRDPKSWTFSANGAGFKRTEAIQLAEERLTRQIEHETKISLNL